MREEIVICPKCVVGPTSGSFINPTCKQFQTISCNVLPRSICSPNEGNISRCDSPGVIGYISLLYTSGCVWVCQVRVCQECCDSRGVSGCDKTMPHRPGRDNPENRGSIPGPKAHGSPRHHESHSGVVAASAQSRPRFQSRRILGLKTCRLSECNGRKIRGSVDIISREQPLEEDPEQVVEGNNQAAQRAKVGAALHVPPETCRQAVVPLACCCSHVHRLRPFGHSRP